MSAQPPPQPPQGPYAPGYSREALRAQRQMLRAQARMEQQRQRALRCQMREHHRQQRRAQKRGSIVAPLLILALGVTLLLSELGRIRWVAALRWYGLWWPVVMIGAGVILLLEWMVDQGIFQRIFASKSLPASSPGASSLPGDETSWAAPGGQGRALSGGLIFLLVLLALAGVGVRLLCSPLAEALAWRNDTLADGSSWLSSLFGERYDADSSLAGAIPQGTALMIHDPRGDVTVSGSSSDGQVHVNVHAEAHAWDQARGQRKIRALQPVFAAQNGVLSLNGNDVEGGQADLTVTLPHGAAVTIVADHGDVTVNETSGAVTVSARHGDVDVSGVNNSVTLHMNDDDASLSLHSIHGPVVVEGHCGDIDISEVDGDLTLQGDFFGSTDLEHIAGAIRFETSRTQFSAARLEDEFDVDSDSLDASQLLGPVVVKTVDKNITLDRVQGAVEISDRNGSVELTHPAPLDVLSIENHDGSVDVDLPGGAGFSLDARTRNGEMENDFGLTAQRTAGASTLQGQVAGGGPTVTISTTDGDVTLRRSSVAPLPPVAVDRQTAPRTDVAPRAGGTRRRVCAGLAVCL